MGKRWSRDHVHMTMRGRLTSANLSRPPSAWSMASLSSLYF